MQAGDMEQFSQRRKEAKEHVAHGSKRTGVTTKEAPKEHGISHSRNQHRDKGARLDCLYSADLRADVLDAVERAAKQAGSQGEEGDLDDKAYCRVNTLTALPLPCRRAFLGFRALRAGLRFGFGLGLCPRLLRCVGFGFSSYALVCCRNTTSTGAAALAAVAAGKLGQATGHIVQDIRIAERILRCVASQGFV